MIMKDSNVILVCPRNHGKSTWFSLIYPLWCILFETQKFILLISDTQPQASSFLGGIIAELETNEHIIGDFGKIAGFVPPKAEEKQKWTSKDITTLTGTRVMALGANSKFRGIRHREQRPTLIIIDDFENDLNVQSDDQRAKLGSLFRKGIMNLGTIGTRFAIVGTILHFDSLLLNLYKKPPPDWETRFYKAIENGKSIWPALWTLEALEAKRKEIGNIAFECEYMNNPLDPSQQIIKPREFYEWYDAENCDHFAYIDLAISEKKTADYTAIVTIGRHRLTGKLYVVEPVRGRWDVEAQLEKCFYLHKKYKYKKFGVEEVAYQAAFQQILKLEGNRRGIYVPAVGVEVDKDKIRRAVDMTPYVDNGTVLFHNGYQDFMSEIIQFPKSAHDDFVDALGGAIKIAVKSSGSGKVATGGRVQYPH